MVMRSSIHRAALPALLYLLTCETAVLAGATADTLQFVPADRGHLSFSDSNSVSVAALAADAAADSVGGSPVVAADGSKAIRSNRSSSNNDSSLPPLIPLQVLLSPARFRLPQLSPDGNFLAFLQPSKETGINSVFVAALPPSSGSSTSSTSTRTRTSTSTSSTSVGSSSSSIPSPSSSSSDSGIDSFSLLAQGLIIPQRVTDTPTPVGDFFWSKDSKGILFVVDSGAGSEDYHLYWVPLTVSSDGGSSGSKQQGDAQSVKITPGAAVNLTPFKGVKTQGLWLSQTDPSHVFVGLNRREKSVFDIHSIDLKSQDMTLDTVNPGNVTAWVVTPDFTIGAAVMVGAGDGSRHLVYRDPNTPDGCPAAPTAAAAATSSSKQPVYLQNAVANSSAQQQQQQQQQQQRRYAQGHSKDTKVLTSGSSGGSIGRSTGRRLLQVIAGNDSMGVVKADSSSTTGSGGIGRRLLQLLADTSAAAGYLADSSSAVSSSSSSSGSSQSVNDAIAESSSKSRVACWRRVYEWPFGEDGRVWGFNQDADGIFITSSVERDTTELQLISTNSDKPGTVKQRIASHPLVDVNDVIFDMNDRQPAALSLDYHKPVWSFAHKEDQQEWDRLEAWRPGEVASPVSSSQDKRVWIVEYSRGNGNTAFYLHRRGTFPPELLFNQQPTLSNYTLATTHLVVVKARDGLDIPGYLTLPVLPNIPVQLPKAVAGQVPDPHSFAVMQRSSKPPSQPQQQQQREGAGVSKVDWKLPMVLMVHGGPWRRTSWGTSASLTQWLANRGYAVLNVNFRGSTGYGKKFTHQGDNQWGVGSMQHDLSDAVAWAVNSGIADPKRVCIMGSSYGGYATFAGLAFTPQLYRCGISFSGIANLADFARAMPPYWGPIRNRWLLRVGNVTADEALNRRLSPVFHAQNIRAPVLIGQGGNDVRVTQVEAAAMFNALKRQRHKEVQFVLYPDEGHSITRLANRLDFYSRAEQLLGDVLGGRKQDFVKHKLTSAQVKA